jgi:hypothetical protein
VEKEELLFDRGKLLCLNIYLETGLQSYRDDSITKQKKFTGHKHLAPGNRVAEKEGFLFGRFQGI